MSLVSSRRRGLAMHWGNGWHDSMGGWGWLVMALVMATFWGGVVWIVAKALGHGLKPASGVPATGPEDILHDRFARGEIDVDEYHHRLDAVRSKRLG